MLRNSDYVPEVRYATADVRIFSDTGTASLIRLSTEE